MSSRRTPSLRSSHRFTSLLGALALTVASSAFADTTALTLGNAVKGTSKLPVSLQFPVARSGDLGYQTILNYHTTDGTAIAGTDYAGTSGSVVIPANLASALIPVTLNSNTGAGVSRQFQLIVDSAVGIGPMPTFAAKQAFVTGTSPESIAAADLNGDGEADLIVANRGGNTVSVLLNITAPGASSSSFRAQQTFATGNTPASVIAADVNGDGKPDLVVANYASGTVSVLLNTTGPGAAIPSFAAQQTFATGSDPDYITVADVNGDGKPDLIIANYGSNNVSVLLNTTAPGASVPSFAPKQTFATGAQPAGVVAVDVNGDGKPDLIVANQTDNTVSVLLNTTTPGAGTSSFAAQQTFATGSLPSSVATADVNGDGEPDLIVANNGDNTVSVLLNTTAPGASSPSFAAQQTFGAGNAPTSITAADVNGDGKPDLIVANNGDSTISVLLNTGMPGASGASFIQQTFGTGSNPTSVVAADLNGDGKPDLIAANVGDNDISVLLNTTPRSAATSNFATQQIFGTGSEPTSVAAADLNGDGKPELIVTNYVGNTVSVLVDTTAAGARVSSFVAQQAFATGSQPDSVTTADVNGDGKPDLIIANHGSNTVSVLLNTTAPGASALTFAAQQTFAVENYPSAVIAADVNGDGKPDLIVANYGSATVSVLLNTTAPGATTPSFAAQQLLTFATGTYPGAVFMADVNGDGKPDLIVANHGTLSVSVLLNTTVPGAGTASFAALRTFGAGVEPSSVIAADVNGDGKPDLVVANFGDATISVLLNTTAPGATTPTFAAEQTFSAGTQPVSIVAADLDGDGKPDLVVANHYDNTASVLLNTTATGASIPSFAAQQVFGAGNSPYSLTTADINGDGRPDLIVANINDNTLSVLLNTQYQTTTTGSPVTGTIVHDYIFADGFGP